MALIPEKKKLRIRKRGNAYNPLQYRLQLCLNYRAISLSGWQVLHKSPGISLDALLALTSREVLGWKAVVLGCADARD